MDNVKFVLDKKYLVKRESCVEAVKRLGDYWYASKYLRGPWLSFHVSRAFQRHDLVDLQLMRQSMRRRHALAA